MYSSSLCVSKVKCVCLGRVLCAFDFLRHCAASRQQGGSRQECNTKENTSSVLWNKWPDDTRLLRMHTYEQTRLWDQIQSSFFRGETVSIYVASKGHLEPSAPWKAIEDSLSLSHSFSLRAPTTIAGWAGLGAAGPPPAPPVCSTPIIYVHWRWCKVLERL